MDDAVTIVGIIPAALVSYVRRAAGDYGVGAALAAAGLDPGVADVRDSDWLPIGDVLTLAAAASEVCGDQDIGRRTGEELHRIHAEAGTLDFLRAVGSTEAAFREIMVFATKMSTGRHFAVVDRRPNFIVAEARSTRSDRLASDPFFCGLSAGYWSQVPALFGADATVIEPKCEARGDACCRFEVRWRTRSGPVDPADALAGAERSDRAVARFEELQAMAADLTQATEIDTVLERIVDRVGSAAMAPRFVLAVRLHQDDPLRVHHRGFDRASDARLVAERVLAGENVSEWGAPLVVEVASPGVRYGRLAALFAVGSDVTEVERRHLAAYAGHATAALEAAANLEALRRSLKTTRTLLELAHALSQVATVGEVAERLAAAVPTVVGCQYSGVWLWDPPTSTMRVVARSAGDAEPPLLVLGPDDLPQLRGLVDDPRPFELELESAGPVVGPAMQEEGVGKILVVPLVAREELLGVVTAGFTEEHPSGTSGDLVERLLGLAYQAARALDSARLLDTLRHRAQHDELTGLPNRAVAEERLREAIGGGRSTAAALFLDLDRFKAVNDAHGHAAGDEVIRAVCERIVTTVRTTDTVARIGGDEVLVVLPRTTTEAASEVAAKLLAALEEPFPVAGTTARISTSIGIAVAPEHGTEPEILVRHADAAMYAAKAAGRGTYRVATVGDAPAVAAGAPAQ